MRVERIEQEGGHRRTVLVLLSSGEDFAQRRLQGVQRFAEAVDWDCGFPRTWP